MDLNIVTSNGEKIVLPRYSEVLNTEMVNAINAENVQKTFTQYDHPNPIVVVVIILIIIYLIYELFIHKVKHCFNGIWYLNNDKITIKHNKYNDDVKIMYINGMTETGHVKGNAIYIKNVNGGDNMAMGIYDDKKIYWLNGEVWIRSIYAI
jgi:hypothetical protein